MSDAFEEAFMVAVDDLNAGRLHENPNHYLRTVPALRHDEFTRRLTALMAARGPGSNDDITSEAYDAALSAVSAVNASAGSTGILPGALCQLRKIRGIERNTVIDALAAEYQVGPAGRDVLRRYYHQLESGALIGPNIAHRLLRSLAKLFDSDAEDFIAAVRPSKRSNAARPTLTLAPSLGRSAGEAETWHAPDQAAEGRHFVGPDPDVELVERLFTGGPDA
jgi:hypothetical protein